MSVHCKSWPEHLGTLYVPPSTHDLGPGIILATYHPAYPCGNTRGQLEPVILLAGRRAGDRGLHLLADAWRPLSEALSSMANAEPEMSVGIDHTINEVRNLWHSFDHPGALDLAGRILAAIPA